MIINFWLIIIWSVVENVIDDSF